MEILSLGDINNSFSGIPLSVGIVSNFTEVNSVNIWEEINVLNFLLNYIF